MNAEGHLFLVGFMGAGKSTVGRLLAARLGKPFVDCDERIQVSAGSTIPEVFACDGEAAFREMETALLETLKSHPAAVVACGGGIVIREENRAKLADSGRVIYLQVDYDTVLRRIEDLETRPLLAASSIEAGRALLDQRRALYESVADITIDTVGKTPKQIAEKIAAAVGGSS